MKEQKFVEGELKIFKFNESRYVIAKDIKEAIDLYEAWKDADTYIYKIELISKQAVSKNPKYINEL